MVGEAPDTTRAGARALAFIGAGRPRARLPMAVAAWSAVRHRWAQMGFGGPTAGPEGRVGSMGSTQSGRIGFLFFRIYS
jgi:hypothetical protein